MKCLGVVEEGFVYFRELFLEFEEAGGGVWPELAVPAADEGLEPGGCVSVFQEVPGVADGGLGDDDGIEFFG